MGNGLELTITPTRVLQNATLTIRSESNHFPEPQYTISDESGRIIRKGSVNQHIGEFKLSMVGLSVGSYQFRMGLVQEKFIIIN